MSAATVVLTSTLDTTHRPRRKIPPSLIAGGSILGVIIVLAIFAPLIAPYNPNQINLNDILAGPSAAHWLGTDQLGRDVVSRLLYGARTDLTVAFIAVISPFILGTILGAIAGYTGGLVDAIIMRVADVIVAFPFYVLVLLLVFLLGPGVRSIIITVTVVSWVAYARIIRSSTLVAKSEEYVLFARVGGLRKMRIIVRHILPNVITQAVIYAMSDIVLDIVLIVTLGYLGLGIPPPAADWGAMMASGQQFLTTDWALSTIPGIAVVITGLGLSLTGDGLAEILRVK
jgi:peptide/nickel transport system permease protein